MAPHGLELPTKSPGKQGLSEKSGANLGAFKGNSEKSPDADLDLIVSAWPSLSATVRAAILALVDGAMKMKRG
jgi:hypothetical protein